MATIPNSIYVLTIRRRGQTDGTFTFYAQGISATNMNLHDVVQWTISRMSFCPPAKTDIPLNKHFIAFQRLWRAYRELLRVIRNPRFLLARETGSDRLRLRVYPPPMATLYAAPVSASGVTAVT